MLLSGDVKNTLPGSGAVEKLNRIMTPSCVILTKAFHEYLQLLPEQQGSLSMLHNNNTLQIHPKSKLLHYRI